MAAASDQATHLLSPADIRHFVLGTTPENYDVMADFYTKFLGAEVSVRSEFLTMLRYDHEHHRLGIAAIPGTKSRNAIGGTISGLRHVAFGFNTLGDLATFYEQRKAQGILPDWVVNHGLSTSMYYLDPDGNQAEVLVDNFDTSEEAIAYMASPEFQENPIGVEFDPEEFVRKVRNGVDEKEIKTRPNIGRRMKR
ncbi:Glyoxalase/Bleomycin resistance protein/Dihydroxybiphenyl dioxygenase [Aspergillus keveii]|uniref:Glyoxalase/Bleomycin resistance protein/Dihydroxybiphenyl dioxygenase n=1 Tax=Aspergillus keveii TaxID=714993 RepID=A0ABR4FJ47_9EURO